MRKWPLKLTGEAEREKRAGTLLGCDVKSVQII